MRRVTGRDELPLVVFTVLTQAAVGTSVVRPTLGRSDGLDLLTPITLALLVVGGCVALFHLGRPGRARFALSNLRSSWLSREIALGAAFGLAVALNRGIASAVLGLLLVLAIARIYMIRTVPPWNTWMTPAAFLLTTVLLGAAINAVAARVEVASMAVAVSALVGLQLVVAVLHYLRFGRGKQRASFAARIALLIAGAALIPVAPEWAMVSCCVLLFASEFLGRYLFYASHQRVGL